VNELPLFSPFRGEHYADPGSLARRLAPPYDVIDAPLREQLAAQDEANIVRVDLPVAPEGEDPYRVAARLLGEWRARGLLTRDGSPSAYVLRTTSTFEGGQVRSRTGVFLAVAAEPFSRGRVKPHEQTHKGPKEDRRRLTHATAANLSPIFLLAPDADGRLAARLREVTATPPWASADAIGARHEVWLVAGAKAKEIAETASAGSVYIADGHHRYETAVTIRGEAPAAWQNGARRTLAHVVSFKDPGLEILATHRIVPGAPQPRAAVLAAAARFFAPAEKGMETLTLVFSDGSEAPLALKDDAPLAQVATMPAHPAVRSLAVARCDAIMVNTVAGQLLGQVPHLRYTPVAADARAAARKPDVAFAILLPPTKLEEVKAVSDAGQIMPPKSTYFAPKVPTGVVLRPMEGDS
jgi:uncharacterized protein (DUF1015 family)